MTFVNRSFPISEYLSIGASGGTAWIGRRDAHRVKAGPGRIPVVVLDPVGKT